MLTRKVHTAWRLLRTDPGALLSTVARVDAFHIFSARPDTVPPPELLPDTRIVRLTDDEMRALPAGWEEQTNRFQRYGFHAAYGVYVGHELAHINWLITPEQDRLRKDRVVKLRPGEAEIAHGFTLPEFRRRGLQRFTIRALAKTAAEMGVRRLFSITVAGNVASMRGITSAGLPPYARAYRLVLAPSHAPCDIVIRGHRMPWRLLLKSNARETPNCPEAPAALSR